MLLPQVAEAVGAIALIYFTVKRWLGATPGLLAAAGLAVTPIVAALAHSEISDTLLMLLLTAAAYTTPAVWAASTTQAAYSGNSGLFRQRARPNRRRSLLQPRRR